MTIDFKVLSAVTVPDTYIWDQGVPLSGNAIVPAYTTNTYASGYAPGLKVKFANLSIPDPEFTNATYTWNFGDFYNDTTNVITVTSNEPVEHTYVMPGNYNVTLTLNQNRIITTLQNILTLCRGKYGINWFWDRLTSTVATNLNWDETKCIPATPRKRPKWWDDETACLEKYCKQWSWYENSSIGANPVEWLQTKTFNSFEKQWQYEINDTPCAVRNAEFLDTLQTSSNTKIITNIVHVKEKMPIAFMEQVTSLTSTNLRKIEVSFSPFKTVTGSFPIDRIDWDFGDGSPILTLTRYTAEVNDFVYRNNAYNFDVNDVRNYNVKHTYNITNLYPLFYPSLTCYSASSNSYSSCSLRVGPLIHPSTPLPIVLLKSRNTEKGNLHTLFINNNITFFTTNSSAETLSRNITKPSSPMRDSTHLPQPQYYGNPGYGYLNAPEIPLT